MCQPSKEVKGKVKGRAVAAVRQVGTDGWSLPGEQRVFDFLAIAELFLFDAKELATIPTGLRHWSNWVIHNTERHTHTSVPSHSIKHLDISLKKTKSHLTKPTSSQLMLARNSLADEEHTWRHLLWVESNTLRCWSAEFTWTAIRFSKKTHDHFLPTKLFKTSVWL